MCSEQGHISHGFPDAVKLTLSMITAPKKPFNSAVILYS